MLKDKSWVWNLTIFANTDVTTTISPHIYLGKNYYDSNGLIRKRIIKHEEIHLKQQKKVGVLKYLFLYVFVFPLFWNKYRFDWEYEAYINSGTSKQKALEYLKKWNYGWLNNK
ncbi:hypothetical protein J4467_01120 [Candidatus Woesearchaeota archaeon]|nr:hypothetical protein [Candidatus Woesearchaeota archaeon]